MINTNCSFFDTTTVATAVQWRACQLWQSTGNLYRNIPVLAKRMLVPFRSMGEANTRIDFGKICIVGAGPSGVAAALKFLEHDITKVVSSCRFDYQPYVESEALNRE